MSTWPVNTVALLVILDDRRPVAGKCCWELTTAASDVATACWEEANSAWEVQGYGNTKGGGGGGCMRDHEQFPAEKKVTQKKTQVGLSWKT